MDSVTPLKSFFNLYSLLGMITFVLSRAEIRMAYA